jgi:hypothetical protein
MGGKVRGRGGIGRAGEERGKGAKDLLWKRSRRRTKKSRRGRRENRQRSLT